MVKIRQISLKDNEILAHIIRTTLAEFGANKPGTVYFDESTDHLFEVFQAEKSNYFVVELDGEVVGGGGIYPSKGLDHYTCELVKMYLLPKARGRGISSTIIDKCIHAAKSHGFQNIYLETMPELKNALAIYEKKGWTYLPKAMGCSGHDGCPLWMIKNIYEETDKIN